MQDFPKWMLALAGSNLVGILLAPLYLFGGLQPFGPSGSLVLRFLQYLLVQSFWIVPLLLFFVSLDRYRRGWPARGIAFALIGAAIEICGISLLV